MEIFIFNVIFKAWIYIFSGHLPDTNNLLEKEDMVRMKRCIYAMQRDGLPPVTTHNVASRLKIFNYQIQL